MLKLSFSESDVFELSKSEFVAWPTSKSDPGYILLVNWEDVSPELIDTLNTQRSFHCHYTRESEKGAVPVSSYFTIKKIEHQPQYGLALICDEPAVQ